MGNYIKNERTKLARNLKEGDIIKKPDNLNTSGDYISNIRFNLNNKSVMITVEAYDGAYERILKGNDRVKVYAYSRKEFKNLRF